jgi:hypothetical protein
MLSKKLYWRRLTGTINFPPPRLLRIPSPLHNERIVSWVKFVTHALLDGDGALNFKSDPLLIGLALYGRAARCDVGEIDR